ncbi:hypothetical protein [Cryptosporangium arvum]|uniref:hypothetical protein n=1 Tax=Cryptosporangium arvum TaxID=80871 RepID=UPI0004B49B96|nr:hypothetical protein [Cryptosporangium arvum]
MTSTDTINHPHGPDRDDHRGHNGRERPSAPPEPDEPPGPGPITPEKAPDPLTESRQ